MSAGAHARIVELGTPLRRPSGATIFNEGDSSTSVYAIVSGRVRIEVSTPSGNRLVIAAKGPGEIFGEFGALDGAPRSASALAVEPVFLVQLATTGFLELLEREPALSVSLLQTLSGQLRQAVRRVTLRNSADTTTRLAHRLADLADRFGEYNDETIDIELTITQDDLAGWIGATRESTARSLRSLRERGLVTTGRKRISVPDVEALRRVSS